jgi:hypothetical protein
MWCRFEHGTQPIQLICRSHQRSEIVAEKFHSNTSNSRRLITTGHASACFSM